MPEFEVSYLSSTYEYFFVTADTKEEAESLVWEGNLLPDDTENNSWVHSWTILRGEDSLIRAIPPYDEEDDEPSYSVHAYEEEGYIECTKNCADWTKSLCLRPLGASCPCECHY